MYLSEVDLVTGRPVRSVLGFKFRSGTYSSSMTSSGGNGSSRPRLIISHWNSCSSPLVLLGLSFWYVGIDAFLESKRLSSEVSNGFDDCVRVVGAPC